MGSDGHALLGARTSAGFVMMKFGTHLGNKYDTNRTQAAFFNSHG